MKSRQSSIVWLSFFPTTAFIFHCHVVVLLATAVLSASNNGSETDQQALLTFKSMITYDPNGALSSWNTSSHFCDWSGVSCEKWHTRVTSLELNSLGLQGSLSPYLGNLSFLRRFSISNNSFQETIPHELGHLSRLRFLNLDQNNFNGPIPVNLSGCLNLETLDLANNKLVGNIPSEIRILLKLTFLSLHDNILTGGIPPFLGNMTSMEVFTISGNPLGGNIPESLDSWKSLTELRASGCNLNGTIPRFVYNLSFLTILSLSDNHLHGSLPLDIGALLPHLVIFQLRNNTLTGFLPPSLSNCSKLQSLEMNDNCFSGKLTTNFEKLIDIHRILLQNNLFGSGEEDEMKFIDSLGNCSKLIYLGLGNCKFQGVLPKSIGNLSRQLQILNLGANQLYGNLPSSVGNLVGLTSLSVVGNTFAGNIPSTIGMLQNLQGAFLYENQFSGSIPDSFGNLSRLIILSLRSNRLEGDIPPCLGNFLYLQKLELSSNQLSGNIPKQLFQLPSLSVLLNLSRNNLSGPLPTEVGDLKILSNLALFDNNLSGNIPSNIGGCASLSLLSLKGNLFQGTIPSSFSSLRGLVKLDLSQNDLSGQIPPFFESISFTTLNLSYNDFEGQVPVLGVFANASAFSVLGNSRLCGGLLETGLPSCDKITKHKKKLSLYVILILITFTLFIFLCFVYASRKRKTKSQPSHSLITEQFLKVSYNQLLKTTNGFSEANLIGVGGFSSVYKGTLDHGDRFVAVKVLHLQNRGAHKSFIAECEVLRRIRHRNLLKIITLCSSVDFQGHDFKALVYEFMSNGSLHDWLHSSANASKLNLLQRINILIDVASALDYLHNHCLPAVVHGDIKPSNILLDDDMVAHVGDFGLARFLGTDSNGSSSTGISGTIGYTPPEYGLGSEMTSSGDVYSFGILLLEMMTGKKPTHDIFKEGLSLHKFAYMALQGCVTKVIEGDLLNFHQDDTVAMQNSIENEKKIKECMALTVQVGVLCSVDSPPLRMDIKNVIHELQNILNVVQSI